MVGNNIDRAHPKGRHRVPAVHALAKAEETTGGGNLWTALERLGPHNGRQYFELRQFDVEIAAEQPAPSATREHDGIAGDPALFGDCSRHATSRSLDAPHGATGDNRGTVSPCCF